MGPGGADRQLNEELRQAQLARELAAQVAKRHVMVVSDEAVLTLTAPLHARVKASPRTIRAVLTDSPIPRGAFDGAFRRITRPLGPLARRQPNPAPARPGLLQRLNEGLSAAPVPPTPGTMATPARSGTGLVPPGTAQSTVARRRRRYRLLLILAIVLGIPVPVFLLLGVWAVAAILAVLAAPPASSRVRRREQRTSWPGEWPSATGCSPARRCARLSR